MFRSSLLKLIVTVACSVSVAFEHGSRARPLGEPVFTPVEGLMLNGILKRAEKGVSEWRQQRANKQQQRADAMNAWMNTPLSVMSVGHHELEPAQDDRYTHKHDHDHEESRSRSRDHEFESLGRPQDEHTSSAAVSARNFPPTRSGR